MSTHNICFCCEKNIDTFMLKKEPYQEMVTDVPGSLWKKQLY